MRTLRRWGPIVATLLMIAWSNIPPYRGQIRGEERALFVWNWRLYEHGGGKICDVRYFDMHDGGALIQRWTLLGYDRPGRMPDKLGRVHQNQLLEDHARVCAALQAAGDPRPNVEVAARCGVELGWKVVALRERNVCAPRPAKTPAKTTVK